MLVSSVRADPAFLIVLLTILSTAFGMIDVTHLDPVEYSKSWGTKNKKHGSRIQSHKAAR